MPKKIFKYLTEEDKQYLTHIFYENSLTHREKVDILLNKHGVSERTIRKWWKEDLKLSEKYSTLPLQLQEAQKRELKKNTDFLIVTAAQNKTGVNKKLLENIFAYKKHLESIGVKPQIVVAPTKYRNPTSPSEHKETQSKTQDWWRDEVLDYLYYGKIQFGDCTISSDSRVRPTAKEPLSGYDVMARENHLIIPHPKKHLKTMPRHKGDSLRIMATTGFVTHKNYSDSKIGDQSFETHKYGFIVVELKKDGKCHPPRNVEATPNGDFTDVCFEVQEGKVKKVKTSEAFVWGDIHGVKYDEEILKKTAKLKKHLFPKEEVLHDLLDGNSFNPHEEKDFYIQRRKIVKNQHKIDEEIKETLRLLSYINDQSDSKVNVVASNHDVFLDRLINNKNWKNDLHNSPAYLKYAYIQQTEDLEEYGGIFGYLLKEFFGDEINYVNYDESLRTKKSIDLGDHGDFGINGSKGNYKSFSRLNLNKIIGHLHSPTIHNGIIVVGVSCILNQYFNRKGLSSWAHAHSVVHDNGLPQLLIFGDDKQITNLVKL